MRKFFGLLFALILIFSLTTTVFAASAPSMSSTSTMASDGSCQVSIGLTLRLDDPKTKIMFPLPEGATAIRVNGDRAIISKGDGIVNVDLQYALDGLVGDVTLNIQYELYNLVNENNIGVLELKMPLLSGFEYPISNLTFTINLPGEIKERPSFSSGYHQASIEQFLSFSVSGNTLSGSALNDIKDHETLVMTLPVDDNMFPQMVVEEESTLFAQIGMAACAGLALLLWLLCLRSFPKAQRCSEPPVGINAGQVGCIVGNRGIDLTLTVFTWAQLGYLTIQPGKRGRVLLHKRMEMGNERSEYEQQAFERLFGSRFTIDATGSRYAAVAGALSGRRAGMDELFRKFSCNPLFLRLLCAGIGIAGGCGIGSVMGSGTGYQELLTVFLGICGGISAWLILGWTDGGLYRRKHKLAIGWILAAAWVVLSVIAGRPLLGVVMVAELLVFGILYGRSGLRTALGKQTAGQLLGLRRYLQGKELEQLDRACDQDPEYFFRMFPYAVALGVGRSFAKAVCDEGMERCPYLAYEKGHGMDSMGWYELLVRIVDAMDAHKRSRLLDNLMYLIRQK